MGFPCSSAGKESACYAGDLGSIPGLGRSPGEGNPTPIFSPRAFHGWWSLVSYSPWGHKELDTTELWNKENIHIFDFTRHCYVDLVNSGSLSVVSDSLQFHGLYSLALLRGIFPTQGSNPGLPHCRRILYQLSHKGSLLAIVNSAAVNIGVHVSFSIIVSSECMPSSGIAGSYGSFIPSF